MLMVMAGFIFLLLINFKKKNKIKIEQGRNITRYQFLFAFRKSLTGNRSTDEIIGQ